MKQLTDELAESAFMGSLRPQTIATIAGCGQNRVFRQDELIFREGRAAHRFYVIRGGSVALETFVPDRGPLVIETLHAGDPLGWSWLFPPYREAFDARALDDVRTVEFDGDCLRTKSDGDPDLGYELMKLFGSVLVERLQHTRLRLLDVYAPVHGS